MTVSAELDFLFLELLQKAQQQIPFPYHWPVLRPMTIPSARVVGNIGAIFFS